MSAGIPRFPGVRRTTAVVCLAAAVGAVGLGTMVPRVHRGRHGQAVPTTAPSVPAPVPAPQPEPPVSGATWSGTVELQVYGPDGSALSWDAFRDRQTNGGGEAAANDTLVDPDSLVVLARNPLRPGQDTTARFDLPGRPAGLALAWPTSLGYSTLLVDLPGTPGREVLNVLAARSLVTELERLRQSAPTVDPGPGLDLARPAELLEVAEQALRAGDEVGAAAAADRAADAATIAITELAAAQGVALGRGRDDVIAGVTFDRAEISAAEWDAAVEVLGDRGRRWIRVVLDLEAEPGDYLAVLEEADRRGLSVLAQVLDSSEMAALSRDEWRQRVRTFVDALPMVAAWEVGNEVNGSWLGDPTEVAARVAEAAADVQDRTDAAVMVTLYWQLGEEEPRHALFNWLRDHPDALAGADLVGLSIYPGEHPLGSGVERVLRTLEAAVAPRPVVIGELGYGSADLDRTWWWGSPDDPAGAARRAVADLYQRVAMRRGGGAFWWYFLQEVPGDDALRSTLSAAVAAGR